MRLSLPGMLTGWFGGEKEDPCPAFQGDPITPESVEALIDAAGRDAVFARARSLGWSGPAPLWVWQQIALEVMHGRPATAPPADKPA
jgi:hypothetical protein